MSIVQTLLVIFGLLNLAFAGFLYLHSNKRAMITFYALISFFASLWSLSTLATGIEGLPFEYFILAAQGHYIFGYLAYLSFLWFALYYPTRPNGSLKTWTLISVISLGFIALIPISNLLFIDLLAEGPLRERIIFNTTGYVAFILMLSSVFFAGLLVLLKKLATTSEAERWKDLDRYQLYFALLANFVAGVLGITLNLILPLYGNFSFFYANPILVTIALTGIGLYNLLKYNLFNTKVVLAEFFTAGLFIVSLARVVVSDSPDERWISIILLGATVVFGIFLIQSVLREVRGREKIESLAKDLEKANARLKELDRQKTEFVSIASHQLRSPLTAIKGYSSLILEGSYGKVPKQALEAVKKIFDSSKYMAISIEDFLNVSRIELGTVKYDLKDFSLGTMAKEITDELQPAAAEKKLTLECKTEGAGVPVVTGDIGKLRQVVLNLVDNAMKYTKEGGITVTVSVEASKRVAQIAIADTGVGIPSDVMPLLFRKFSRAKNANEVNVMGTGLGLYVAKQFVEAHKGRIWASSRGQGLGSTFFVELPLAASIAR